MSRSCLNSLFIIFFLANHLLLSTVHSQIYSVSLPMPTEALTLMELATFARPLNWCALYVCYTTLSYHFNVVISHCSSRRVTKSSFTSSSTRWRTYSETAFCLYGWPTTYATKNTKGVSGDHGSRLSSSPSS